MLLRDRAHLDRNPDWVHPGSALLEVYDMALGDFEVTDFKHAPGSPLVAVLLFVIFMFVVPIVMLNALIAIMVRDYCIQNGVMRIVRSPFLTCVFGGGHVLLWIPGRNSVERERALSPVKLA
jgi:hypothetical protein